MIAWYSSHPWPTWRHIATHPIGTHRWLKAVHAPWPTTGNA